MRAPDKIYIGLIPPENGNTKCTAAEYIRKESLLKWAKRGMEKVSQLTDGKTDLWEGERIVFKCLIDKINSL